MGCGSSRVDDEAAALAGRGKPTADTLKAVSAGGIGPLSAHLRAHYGGGGGKEMFDAASLQDDVAAR